MKISPAGNRKNILGGISACACVIGAGTWLLYANTSAPLAEQWWFWPGLLGIFCFFIGLVAVFAGIGGGVLFVPLASAFFPFHLDFIRGTGLLIALAGALAASPALLRLRFANLKLALPAALAASTCSILGACLGLALHVAIIQISLGILILGVAVLTLRAKNTLYPVVRKQDAIGLALGLRGVFTEPSTGQVMDWQTNNTGLALLLFCGTGIIAGMFGLGAGWANVPVLNLVMGAPFKLAVGTSTFVLSITDTSATWVYIHRGCIIPIMAIPAVLGLMGGASLGVRFMVKTNPVYIRRIVIIMLAAAGIRSFIQGIVQLL